MTGKSTSTIGQNAPFAPIWKEIVSRKLNDAGHRALIEGLNIILLGFARFRDVVDVELKMIASGLPEDDGFRRLMEFSVDDLRRLIACYSNTMWDIEKGLDHIFLQTVTEPAMEIYGRPLEDLRVILLNLSAGRLGALDVLRSKKDQSAVAELKNQAARTYKFLKKHGARRQEALRAVKKVLKSHGGQTPNFEFEALEKRDAGSLEPEQEEYALAMLPRAAKKPLSPTFERNERLRENLIDAIATRLLSGHLLLLRWSQIIPSTRRAVGGK
jgi:hypothetical protein